MKPALLPSFLRRSLPAVLLVLGASFADAGPSGSWSQFFPPTPPVFPQGRVSFAAAYDPDGARMVIFGGYPATTFPLNDTWQVNLTGSPAWTQLSPAGTVPSVRWAQSSVYDPVRKQMIIMGGYDNTIYFNTVYTLSLTGTPTWTQVSPAGSPPAPRRDHRMVYDPAGDRLIVFGGYTGGTSFVNDVWSLNLSGPPVWTQLAPVGTPPSGRSMSYVIDDPVGNRLLLFGGWDGVAFVGDTWQLSLSGTPTWTQIAPANSPGPRRDGAAVLDAGNARMVIFGGRDVSGTVSQTWTFPLSGPPNWTQLNPAGLGPGGRYSASGVIDAAANRLVICGGYDGANDVSDVWGLSLGAGTETWSPILTPPENVPENADYAMAYDTARDRAVYFGGKQYGAFDQTWAFTLGGAPHFDHIHTAHSPSARYSTNGVYDAVNDRMLVFGGYDGNYLNDLWSLNFTGTPDWTLIPALGPAPQPRLYDTMIADPVRQRLVMFGGHPTTLNDVWVMPFSGPAQWMQLTPAGTPPNPRWGHGAIYDPIRDQMIVFGGFDVTNNNVNDVWALPFGTLTWVPLSPAGTPPPARRNFAMSYDSNRDRILVFGGYGDILGWSNDVWELTLSPTLKWTQLSPTAGPPIGRNQMQSVYEPLADRMMVYGGWHGGPPFQGDSWLLDFSQPTAALVTQALAVRTAEGVHLTWDLGPGSDLPTAIERSNDGTVWNEITPVTTGGSHVDWLDADAPPTRIGYRLVFSGAEGRSTAGETWASAGVALSFGIRTVGPNPASDHAMVTFALAERQSASIDVIDLAGRRVFSRDLGSLEPGEHRFPITGLAGLPTGMYHVRLTSRSGLATSRLMVVR